MKRLLLFLLLAAPCFAQSHSVTLTATDSSCVTGTTCTLQVYRINVACVPGGIGTGVYTELTSALAGTATASLTTWTFVDSTVAAGGTYCYYVTATFSSGVGGASAPSPTFQGNIPSPSPATPTLTGGAK